MGLTVTTQPVSKPWYQSWTVWFNITQMLGSAAQLVLTVIPVSPVTPAALLIVGAASLLLRFKSTTALTLTK